MNLQQLEYIVALDQYKSFSKAADACFITQATLSTMVKKLEEELDMVIFDRKTAPILTTECGKAIVAEAKKLLFHGAHIKHLATEVKGKIEGELKIGVIPTVAGNLLHRILPKLLDKYPKLKLIIQEITTANIVSKLKNGELDVGIVSTPINQLHLEEKILYYEKLLVYGQLKNTTSQYIKPQDIVDEKVWLLEEGNCLSDQVINLCALNPKKLNSNLQFNPNSFDTLINIVDSFNGLTLIPELYYADLSEEKKAKVSEFNSPYPVREISLIFHRPYAKLRLVDVLEREIKQAIVPILQTSKLKNTELIIARM
jgi:LysR family hydrogen peroxide-inducible transcriptional activator